MAKSLYDTARRRRFASKILHDPLGFVGLVAPLVDRGLTPPWPRGDECLARDVARLLAINRLANSRIACVER